MYTNTKQRKMQLNFKVPENLLEMMILPLRSLTL